MRLFLLGLLLLPILSGCVELKGSSTPPPIDSLSAPLWDPHKTRLERIPLKVRDGITLDVVVNVSVEAVEAQEKLPVLVDIGPYFGNLAGDIFVYTGFDRRLAEYFVPRGYAVARASLRGTGESEGCFNLGGEVERRDIYEIVEHLASASWSNGAVAVIGKSYDGTTPWEAAIENPPHLKAIVPISGISDMYRYTYYEGVAYPEELLFEPYYNLLVDMDVTLPGPDGGPPAFFGNPSRLEKNLIRTCADIVEQTRANVQSTLTGDHGDPFWIERDFELLWNRISVPVFFVHGLQDWNVKPDHGIPFFNDLKVPKMAWLGQWAHDYPDINRFRPDWSRHDWNETLLLFFDHFLKGKENGWERLPTVQVQDNLGTWRYDDSWPPRNATLTLLYPNASGGLGSTPSKERVEFDNIDAQGYDPRGKRGGVSFVTDPLPANLTLSGRPLLGVRVSLDRAGGNLVVLLYDVAPNGTWTEVDRGARSLVHATSRESRNLVLPTLPLETEVPLYPQEITFRAGHRIGLVIAAEDPRYFVPSPLGVGGHYSIDLSGTRLLLPVR